MRVFIVLAVVLVLVVLVVSSVSANVIQNPPIYPDSASDGEYHPDDQYSLNKLAPIIISAKRAVSINDQNSLNGGSTITIIVIGKRAAVVNDVIIQPPTTPCAARCTNKAASGTVKPLGGGTIITIIVPTKRAAVINNVIIQPPTTPCTARCTNKLAPIIVSGKRAVAVPDDQNSLNGGSTITIVVTSKRAAVINGVIIQPPTSPCAAHCTNKLAPIVITSEHAATVNHVIITPPTLPDSVPTDQYSLNGGSTITIIVST